MQTGKVKGLIAQKGMVLSHLTVEKRRIRPLQL